MIETVALLRAIADCSHRELEPVRQVTGLLVVANTSHAMLGTCPALDLVEALQPIEVITSLEGSTVVQAGGDGSDHLRHVDHSRHVLQVTLRRARAAQHLGSEIGRDTSSLRREHTDLIYRPTFEQTLRGNLTS